KSLYVKIFFLFLLLFLFIPAFYFFAGQVCYQRARSLIRQQDYQAAADMLEQGADWLPWDSRIQHVLGTLHLMQFHSAEVEFQDKLLSRTLEHLQKAAKLNPLEPQIAASLAHVLELRKKSNVEEILSVYRHVVELSPNTVQYHMLYIDKLYAFDRQEKLPEAVQQLGRIYPGRYGALRRKPYWNSELEEVFAQGMLQAIEDNTDSRKAYMALADIKAQQDQWADAAEQYRLALTLEKHTNTSRQFFQLARYYLHAENLEPAYQAITEALRKQGADPINLQHLYSLFQRTDHKDLFPEFYLFISSELSFSYSEDIAMAELLIEKKQYGQYEFALKLLNRVIRERDYLEKPLRLREKIYQVQGNAGSSSGNKK
ncbi:MAG: hypothetical protein D3916_15890, partial [Candidatus Electrothrix sp. MAN1_4]|nr:hypothetical protein [Candidatus Electrothrix sp. MAN1_4]